MEIKLNLASQPDRDHRGTRPGLLLACVLLGLLLAFNLVGVFRDLGRISMLDNRLQELDEQVAALDEGAPAFSPAAFEARREELARVNAILGADSFRWTGLLNRFEELLPDAVSIRTIQPDYQDRSLQLSCVARDVTAMNLFLDRLLTSPDMNRAFLHRHAMEKEDPRGGPSQVEFSLTVREAF